MFSAAVTFYILRKFVLAIYMLLFRSSQTVAPCELIILERKLQKTHQNPLNAVWCLRNLIFTNRNDSKYKH